MATNRKTSALRQLIAIAVAAALVIVAVVFWNLGRLSVTSESSGASGPKQTVTVGIVGNSDEEVWKAVQSELDRENAGIEVKLRVFQDAIYANQALANGELDLTACQHYAFLEQEEKQHDYDFTVIGDGFITPMNLYSKRYHSVDEFRPGDRIAIPSNASNTGRALKVLDAAGLIRLKDATKENPTVDDIASNPSGVKIELTDPAAIVNLLPDFAAGITNTNFIIDAGMKVTDAVYQAPIDPGNKAFHPYINVVVANTKDKDDPRLTAVIKAYHTKAVADAINAYYKGSVVPVFKY